MNLKRRLNWAAYIIFTLFIAIISFAQVYVVHSQLTSDIARHNTKLEYLLNADNSAEQVFDLLAINYQYERFTLTSSAGNNFSFIAEDPVDWPLITKLLLPASLGTEQNITINGVNVTYILDFSPILNNTQRLLIFLIISLSIVYVLYSLIINVVISRSVVQPLIQFGQALTRMSEFHFSGSEPHNVIDEMKPISRALQKTRIELEGKYKKLTVENRQLQQDAFNDELTGYGNRILFNNDFKRLLEPEQKSFHTGLLCFVRTTQLNKINQEQGFKAGDTYISKIADYLHHSFSRIQTAQLYRINGADFAVLLPNQAEKNISSFANELKVRLDDYQQTLAVESIAYTGIVAYRTGENLHDILSSVDTAVSIAHTSRTNGWHFYKGGETQGSQQWKDTIDEVLVNTRVNLLFQPIIPTRGEKPLYLELFARFYDNDNNELPTQSLIAMAQRHGNATDIDQLVVTNITSAIKAGRFKGQVVGVKLTTASVLSDDFRIWLERHLLASPGVSRLMVFEISCNTIEQNHDNTQQLIAVLYKCGAKISLANFGITPLGFKQLKSLKPDYVKLDRSLTNEIVNDKDDQFYVKQLIDLTHQLRTKIVIVGIETEHERFFVEGLRVDGMQGYFISKPTDISELVTSIYT